MHKDDIDYLQKQQNERDKQNDFLVSAALTFVANRSNSKSMFSSKEMKIESIDELRAQLNPNLIEDIMKFSPSVNSNTNQL